VSKLDKIIVQLIYTADINVMKTNTKQIDVHVADQP